MPIWNPPIYPPETGDLAESTQSTHCQTCRRQLQTNDFVSASRNRDFSATYTRTFWHQNCAMPDGLNTASATAPPPPTAPMPTTTTTDDAASQIAAILQSIAGRLSSVETDISKLRVDATTATDTRPRITTIVVNDTPIIAIPDTLHHKQFPKLVEIVARLRATTSPVRIPINVWLSGPTGSGKTTAAENLAELLRLPFVAIPALATKYDVSGFMDANGRIVSTPFRDAFISGGVLLLDECDASMPDALLAINAALANGYASFPDGMHKRHQDCIVIAAGNTWGHGATSSYVGRAKLDAAFLDRFAVSLYWDYDPNLEIAIGNPDNNGDIASWYDAVTHLRAAVQTHPANAIVSPRRMFAGAQLLRSGASRTLIVETVFATIAGHDSWPTIGASIIQWARH